MEINIKLNDKFTVALNQMYDKYGDRLAKLNGLSDEQLSYTDFIDNFIDKQTVADASIDGNANVGHKDICSLESEMNKPHLKLLAFNKIFYEMEKKYGEKDANDWVVNEWDGHYYLHDFYSSTMKSYCFAYDLEELVKRGLFFIENFNANPSKHLTTFTDFVGEFVSWVSNRSSGACGLPSFLIYSYYFWKKDCESGYYIKDPEYYRDQEFQRIAFKLNQPYLRVNQSAFTNFSIFDRSYLEALFGGKEYPDGTFIIDCIDDILEYQKEFMKVVSEIRSKNMMTFPVLSFCLLRKDGKFADEDFAKWCCRHNMKWADSNFFVSEDVTSLSNCCFAGEEEFCSDKGIVAFNQFNDGDHVRVISHDGKWHNAIVHTYGAQNLCQITLRCKEKERYVFATRNHTWILNNGTRTNHLKRGHRLYKAPDCEMEWSIVDICDANRHEIVWCLEVEERHSFILRDGIVTGNCRLVSDVKNLGYFNSLGGTALEVGSVKVNTINLARLAYENKTEQEYLAALRKSTL